MQRFLKYLWLASRHPHAKDFLNMGLGIEARYARCRKYWAKHIELTKNFQKRVLFGQQDLNVSVLGAGRLLDLDIDLLSDVASDVRLYDADPGVARVWMRLKKQCSFNVDLQLIDITGALTEWEELLRNETFWNVRDAAEILSSLKLPETAPSFEGSECVMSLNILSQLSIYWRDRANKILERRLGFKLAQDPIIQEALRANLALLETQHISQMDHSQAVNIILITDDMYYYYRKDRSHWQEEPALHLTMPFPFQNYKLDFTDSWLWHIAPQGLEHRDYGEIHRVRAFCFSRGVAPHT